MKKPPKDIKQPLQFIDKRIVDTMHLKNKQIIMT